MHRVPPFGTITHLEPMIAEVLRHFLDRFRASAAPRETDLHYLIGLGTTFGKSGFFFDLHSNPANQVSHPSLARTTSSTIFLHILLEI